MAVVDRLCSPESFSRSFASCTAYLEASRFRAGNPLFHERRMPIDRSAITDSSRTGWIGRSSKMYHKCSLPPKANPEFCPVEKLNPSPSTLGEETRSHRGCSSSGQPSRLVRIIPTRQRRNPSEPRTLHTSALVFLLPVCDITARTDYAV